MAKRGRRSSSDLALPVQPLAVDKRIQSPVNLSEAEKQVWDELVGDNPASAFTQTHAPLMEMYCRHVVNNRVISEELLEFDRAWLADDEGLKRYDTLLKIAERESRAASSLATRLRITRQAVEHRYTAGNKQSGMVRSRKPWELA